MKRRAGVLCAGAVLVASLASAGTGYRTDYDYPGQGDDWYGRSGVPDPRRDYAPTRVDTFSDGDDYGRGYEASMDAFKLGPPLERTNSDLVEYVFRFDGALAGGTGPSCNDRDGDGVTDCDGDCDDNDPRRFPGNPEVCDGVDNDCNGTVPADEADGDGDGVPLCNGDCDDNDPRRFPGNPEVCDGVDNDCDGTVPADEADGDGDGVPLCGGDCDDADPSRFPGNPEICDGIDNDCDGRPSPEESDDDGDGITECDGDCDDANADTFPGAVELCDGLDNDCDGVVPDREVDADGDGVLDCQCPPVPDPRGQGYWHRQCLGVPAGQGGIDPGRNGRGPKEPTEPGFVEELMPCADLRLEDLGFYGETTCEGMDADPPSDPCERAMKHLTSLVLNVCSKRLADGCLVDAGPQGCSSALVGDLIEEVAGLIQAGLCEQAASCAEAANEGDALVE